MIKSEIYASTKNEAVPWMNISDTSSQLKYDCDPSMSQIDLLKNISLSIRLCTKMFLVKELHKNIDTSRIH